MSVCACSETMFHPIEAPAASSLCSQKGINNRNNCSHVCIHIIKLVSVSSHTKCWPKLDEFLSLLLLDSLDCISIRSVSCWSPSANYTSMLTVYTNVDRMMFSGLQAASWSAVIHREHIHEQPRCIRFPLKHISSLPLFGLSPCLCSITSHIFNVIQLNSLLDQVWRGRVYSISLGDFFLLFSL